LISQLKFTTSLLVSVRIFTSCPNKKITPSQVQLHEIIGTSILVTIRSRETFINASNMAPPPLITLEEHFFSHSVLENMSAAYVEQFKHVPGLKEKLEDLSTVRLKHMEAGKVSLQVISHAPTPGAPTPEQCKAANDQLAAAVTEHPTRFAGFAVLPMAHPDLAAQELERSVREHKFVGALIDNHVHGTYFDGPEYLPFWSKVAELDVPIYIHPTWASDDMGPRYAGNFTSGASKSLAASGWGWHTETGLHFLRLFASGLFDKFPKVKIVVGHFGEMLPFMLERIAVLSKRWGPLERDFGNVYKENLWITTSGVWGQAPLATILMNTDIEHVLYSVDYPFAKNEDGLKWIEDLEKSGMVSREQLEMIAYKNSEKLLRVKVAVE
jgi:predicted TIM-barrel fold metal-dependent hydrolase